jgi:glycosyltransferase involved in cell wall biosynthesis
MVEMKRVLIILFAGDYYDAYHRMISGKGEKYHHHNYALNSIIGFSKIKGVEEVAVLGCRTSEPYNHYLDAGFRVMGGATDPYLDPQAILNVIEDYKPTHIVLRFPSLEILQWSIKNKVRAITLLADSFTSDSLKKKIFNYRFSRLLNHPQIEWVGNHHVNSCALLKKIGVFPEKIVPWDWPRENKTPQEFEPKTIDPNRKSYTFFYAGKISEPKGVGDLIDALSLLQKQGIEGRLRLAGASLHGIDQFKEQAATLGVPHLVDFLGLVPNEKVVDLMRAADVVFIPSHHRYGEGLPSTIYEALCARTPIVASDHPMFLKNIEDGYSALVFPERQPQAIAECTERLLKNPDLYYALSENSYAAWKRLQIPVTWAGLISRWMMDDPVENQWLRKHTLASDFFKDRL